MMQRLTIPAPSFLLAGKTTKTTVGGGDAPSTSVFEEWLQKNAHHHHASRVKFVSEPYHPVLQLQPPMGAGEEPTPSTTPGSFSSSGNGEIGGGGDAVLSEAAQMSAIQSQLEERNARLVPLAKWPNATARLGTFTVKTDPATGRVRIPDVKAEVFRMESLSSAAAEAEAESTTSSNNVDERDLARFHKFNKDGYLLVRGAFDSNPGVLAALRKEAVQFVSTEHGVDYNADTLELLQLQQQQQQQQPKRAKHRRSTTGRDINETIKVSQIEGDDGDDDGDANDSEDSPLKQSSRAVLHSAEFDAVVRSLEHGASLHHRQPLQLHLRSSWARIRGPHLAPRKHWTEFYFFRDHELNAEEQAKWNRRYAREIIRRKENPKPRFAFSAWVQVGATPVDAGALAVCPGSHHFAGFLHQPRELEEIPMDFKEQVMGMPWLVEDLLPGDMLLLDMQCARAYVQNKHAPNMLSLSTDSMLVMTGMK